MVEECGTAGSTQWQSGNGITIPCSRQYRTFAQIGAKKRSSQHFSNEKSYVNHFLST
jgi:hypothetical protein